MTKRKIEKELDRMVKDYESRADRSEETSEMFSDSHDELREAMYYGQTYAFRVVAEELLKLVCRI